MYLYKHNHHLLLLPHHMVTSTIITMKVDFRGATKVTLEDRVVETTEEAETTEEVAIITTRDLEGEVQPLTLMPTPTLTLMPTLEEVYMEVEVATTLRPEDRVTISLEVVDNMEAVASTKGVVNTVEEVI